MKPVQSIPAELRPDLRFTLPGLQFSDELNVTEQILDRQIVAGKAERIAIYYGPDRWTYGRLFSAVNRFSRGLLDLGIQQGDIVMIRMTSCPEFIVSALALHRIGAVVVPTVVLIRQKNLVRIINSAEARAIIVAAEALEDLEAGLPECPSVKHVIVTGGDEGRMRAKGFVPYEELLLKEDAIVPPVRVPRDELAVLTFTSGTTGGPKGCMHTATAPLAAAATAGTVMGGSREDDVMGGTPPLGFVYGYDHLLLLPLSVGAATSLIPGRATPESLLETAQRDRMTVFNSAPAMYRMILDIPEVEKRYDLSSVRVFLTASAPTPMSTFQEWQERFGRQLVNVMGSNEAFCAFLGTWKAPVKLGSLGYPYPGYECAILDEKGNESPPGVVGRLAMRGPTGTMLWKDPEGQKKATLKGWSFTGDAAYRDEDGCIWHCSRTDDVIKSRGYRISPEEVENALLEHSGVLEVGVIGVPDHVKGEAVKAFVVLRPGYAPTPELAEELRTSARKLIAPYAVPSSVEFIAALPRTDLLKLNRVALREISGMR